MGWDNVSRALCNHDEASFFFFFFNGWIPHVLKLAQDLLSQCWMPTKWDFYLVRTTAFSQASSGYKNRHLAFQLVCCYLDISRFTGTGNCVRVLMCGAVPLASAANLKQGCKSALFAVTYVTSVASLGQLYPRVAGRRVLWLTEKATCVAVFQPLVPSAKVSVFPLLHAEDKAPQHQPVSDRLIRLPWVWKVPWFNNE